MNEVLAVFWVKGNMFTHVPSDGKPAVLIWKGLMRDRIGLIQPPENLSDGVLRRSLTPNSSNASSVLQGTSSLKGLIEGFYEGVNSEEWLGVRVHESSDVCWSEMLRKQDNRGIVHLLAAACSPRELWESLAASFH